MLWPPIRFSFDTVNYALSVPAPAPPSADNWLGTDDQGRDVVRTLIYGFRISVLFGFVLTIISAMVGVSVGAFQGFTVASSICWGNASSRSGPACPCFIC